MSGAPALAAARGPDKDMQEDESVGRSACRVPRGQDRK